MHLPPTFRQTHNVTNITIFQVCHFFIFSNLLTYIEEANQLSDECDDLCLQPIVFHLIGTMILSESTEQFKITTTEIVGTKKALAMAVRNVTVDKRNTMLAERLSRANG